MASWVAGSQPRSTHLTSQPEDQHFCMPSPALPKSMHWVLDNKHGSLWAVPSMWGAGASRQPCAHGLASLSPSACSLEHPDGVRRKPCAPWQAARHPCLSRWAPRCFPRDCRGTWQQACTGISGLSPYSILLNEIISSLQQEQFPSPGKPLF